MPNTAPLAIFLIAALALNISPGPGMLYVISRSLEQDKRAAVALAGHVSDLLKNRSGFSRFRKLIPACILIALGVLVALR
jgi:threonine/homoserine/homoserine lactone efflux protein